MSMRRIILKLVLQYLTKHKCGEGRIPRSGREGEEVNCYSTFLFKQEEPFLIVEAGSDNEIKGSGWDGERFSIPKSITFTESREYQLRITHYYGLYTTKYTGLLDFILFGITKYEVLKCNVHKIFYKTNQFIFNKRRLATPDRIELLRILIDHHFKSSGNSFSSIDIMTMIYSLKWVLHPESDSQEHKLQLFLDSLLETGEIKKVDETKYQVTGKAIVSLSKYEEEERRHIESIKLQRRIVWLTLAIVLVGLVQAIIIYNKE